MTNDRHVKAGNTIVIIPSSPIGSKYGGKKFVVERCFDDGGVIVTKHDGTKILFSKPNYSIVSEQEQNLNQECPECKGTGKVLLFMFESPCSLCSSQRK